MGYHQGIPYSYHGNTPQFRNVAGYASITPTGGEFPIIQLEPPAGTHCWVTKISMVGSISATQFIVNHLPATAIQAASATVSTQANFNADGVATTTVMKKGETNDATTPVDLSSLRLSSLGANNSSRSEIYELPTALYISPGTFFVLSTISTGLVLSATLYWVEKS